MDLVISEDTLRAAHTTADELKQEIAVMLFGQDRLTLVQAAEVAGMSPFAFQHLLASREDRPDVVVEQRDRKVGVDVPDRGDEINRSGHKPEKQARDGRAHQAHPDGGVGGPEPGESDAVRCPEREDPDGGQPPSSSSRDASIPWPGGIPTTRARKRPGRWRANSPRVRGRHDQMTSPTEMGHGGQTVKDDLGTHHCESGRNSVRVRRSSRSPGSRKKYLSSQASGPSARAQRRWS